MTADRVTTFQKPEESEMHRRFKGGISHKMLRTDKEILAPREKCMSHQSAGYSFSTQLTVITRGSCLLLESIAGSKLNVAKRQFPFLAKIM